MRVIPLNSKDPARLDRVEGDNALTEHERLLPLGDARLHNLQQQLDLPAREDRRVRGARGGGVPRAAVDAVGEEKLVHLAARGREQREPAGAHLRLCSLQSRGGGVALLAPAASSLGAGGPRLLLPVARLLLVGCERRLQRAAAPSRFREQALAAAAGGRRRERGDGPPVE